MESRTPPSDTRPRYGPRNRRQIRPALSAPPSDSASTDGQSSRPFPDGPIHPLRDLIREAPGFPDASPAPTQAEARFKAACISCSDASRQRSSWIRILVLPIVSSSATDMTLTPSTKEYACERLSHARRVSAGRRTPHRDATSRRRFADAPTGPCRRWTAEPSRRGPRARRTAPVR